MAGTNPKKDASLLGAGAGGTAGAAGAHRACGGLCGGRYRLQKMGIYGEVRGRSAILGLVKGFSATRSHKADVVLSPIHGEAKV